MLSIEIINSDVFSVFADAIVNPANRQASMLLGSHVNEKIRKMGGKEVCNERKRKGAIKLGEAVFTRGGNLPYKYIIHAAVLDIFDLNPLFLLKLKHRTSRSTLKNAVKNSILIAEDLKINSIVFTPMGAGIGGMPVKKCAQTMLSEIIHFSNKNPDHLIQKVMIAVKDLKSEEVFKQELANINVLNAP